MATSDISKSPLYIDSTNSRVGVGTASPSEVLEVYGTTPNIQINDRGLYQAQIGLIGNDTEFRGSSGNIEFYTGSADGASSTECMRIDTSGNVGIGDGTLSLTSMLHIYKSGATADLALQSAGASGRKHILQSKTDGSLAFYDNNAGTERMRIGSSGNVGIGTASPQELLHLSLPSGTNGDIVRLSRSAGAYSFQLGVSSGSTSNLYISDSSNNKIIDFTSSGNVGIGNSNPQHKFHITHSGTGAIPTDYQMGATSPNDNYQAIHNNNNSATFSGLALETRTSGASRWLIANEWKNTYLGDLVFRNRNAGVTSQESMRIDSSGRVTTPYLPACLIRHAPLSGVNASSGVNLASGFWQAPSGTYFNNGSNFNTSTGRFTAPVSGYYHFTHHLRIDQFGGSYVYTSVLHSSGNLLSRDLRSISTTYQTLHTSGNVYIAANDYIYINLVTAGDSSVNVDGDSFFSCFLIG